MSRQWFRLLADLLAAWPLCTTDQLAGLVGGVTRRRANQVLRTLAEHSLVRTEGERHALTDEGLSCLPDGTGPPWERVGAARRRQRQQRQRRRQAGGTVASWRV